MQYPQIFQVLDKNISNFGFSKFWQWSGTTNESNEFEKFINAMTKWCSKLHVSILTLQLEHLLQTLTHLTSYQWCEKDEESITQKCYTSTVIKILIQFNWYSISPVPIRCGLEVFLCFDKIIQFSTLIKYNHSLYLIPYILLHLDFTSYMCVSLISGSDWLNSQSQKSENQLIYGTKTTLKWLFKTITNTFSQANINHECPEIV